MASIFLENHCRYLFLYQASSKSLQRRFCTITFVKACITAIPKKKGAKIHLRNYRPVNITSIICKLIESIVKDKIITHMERNKLFSQNQHGLVPLRNCMPYLLICMDMWTGMLEKGYQIDIIYTDFTKTSDRVPHQRLLQKMKNLGIIGSTLSWIGAFLIERI